MRDKKGRFIRRKIDKDWLYQKYVVERLTGNEFYEEYGISPMLLYSRIKEFGFKRERIAWNKGKKMDGKYRKKISKIVKKLWQNKKYREKLIKAHEKRVLGKGDKHPNWKGGITPAVMKVRNSKKMKKWRKQVFERDNYICVLCKKRGGKLHADHIVPFSFIWNKNKIKTYEDAIKTPELWNKNNGRTLCVECHKKTETYLIGAKHYDGTNYFGQSALNFS